MFSRYLASTADIVAGLGDKAPAGLAAEMKSLATSLRAAITSNGIVLDPKSKKTVYAYEVDGFGSSVIMDDANIPSLLAAPFIGYLDADDPVYQSTRSMILDEMGVNGNP